MPERALITQILRDRPYHLKGGGGGVWFFVSFRNFFSDNTRVRMFIYQKNSESDYFFFLHQNQNIFFSNTGNQNIFLEKNHNPPLPFKLNGRSLTPNNNKFCEFSFFMDYCKKKIQQSVNF